MFTFPIPKYTPIGTNVALIPTISPDFPGHDKNRPNMAQSSPKPPEYAQIQDRRTNIYLTLNPMKSRPGTPRNDPNPVPDSPNGPI